MLPRLLVERTVDCKRLLLPRIDTRRFENPGLIATRALMKSPLAYLDKFYLLKMLASCSPDTNIATSDEPPATTTLAELDTCRFLTFVGLQISVRGYLLGK